MPTRMNTGAIDVVMKDLYPGAGTQIKQWVVDTRRVLAWESETCPLVLTETHNDNTGAQCRNSGAAQWTHLAHDCCSECDDLHEATRARADVAAWIEARERYRAEHPICVDHDKLSDEIQADMPLRDHPMLAVARERAGGG